MRVKKDKCHVLLSTNEIVFMNKGTSQTKSNISKNVLGIDFD